MALFAGLETLMVKQQAAALVEEQAELDLIDLHEDVEMINISIDQNLKQLEADDNLQAIAACDVSNESLLAIVPFLSQDAEAYEFFGLASPNPTFIRSQLEAAQEGLVGDFLTGVLPFINVYLESVGRMKKLIAYDIAHAYSSDATKHIDATLFNKVKAYHLDLKEQFVNKSKSLKGLLGALRKNATKLGGIDVAGLNQVIDAIGVNIKSGSTLKSVASKTVGAVAATAAGKATVTEGQAEAIAQGVNLAKIQAANVWQITASSVGYNTAQVTGRISTAWDGIKEAKTWKERGDVAKTAGSNVVKSAKEVGGTVTEVADSVSKVGYKAIYADAIKPLTNWKFMAAALSAQSIISGMTSVTISQVQRIYSLPIGAKGWIPADINPALRHVQALLNDEPAVKSFVAELKTSYKEAYKAAADKTARRQITEDYKLLVKLTSLYTKSVVQMARGLHEVCTDARPIAGFIADKYGK